MTEAEVSIRESLLSTLSLIASEAAQREFAEKVPYSSYQDEFACWWFDTFFPDDPSASHMFSAGQIELLKDFSDIFDMSLLALSEDLTIEQLLAKPEWQAVVMKAQKTLAQFQNAL